MTINFSGFKNCGSDITNSWKALPELKIWTNLTNNDGLHLNKYKSLLEKYPSKDNFLRITVSDGTIPIEDSFIRINSTKMKFDELGFEQTQNIAQVRKLLDDIGDCPKMFEIEDEYYNSSRPLEHMDFDVTALNNLDKEDVRDIEHQKFLAHSFDIVKNSAKAIKSVIELKLTERFSK